MDTPTLDDLGSQVGKLIQSSKWGDVWFPSGRNSTCEQQLQLVTQRPAAFPAGLSYLPDNTHTLTQLAVSQDSSVGTWALGGSWVSMVPGFPCSCGVHDRRPLGSDMGIGTQKVLGGTVPPPNQDESLEPFTPTSWAWAGSSTLHLPRPEGHG